MGRNLTASVLVPLLAAALSAAAAGANSSLLSSLGTRFSRASAHRGSPGASRRPWGRGSRLGPFCLAPEDKSSTSLIYALRGGASEEQEYAEEGEDEEKESTETAAATTTNSGTAAEGGDSKYAEDDEKEEEDDLSVEATEDESGMSLGGGYGTPQQQDPREEDIVEISADAFVHPAHPDDNANDGDVGIVTGGADAAELVINFSSLEDEDEGSTTPVTPDEDYATPAEDEAQDLEAEDVVAEEEVGAEIAEEVEEEKDVKEAVSGKENSGETVVSAESLPHDYAEETDYPRGQGTLTDDDSTAFVDRMDLADDEGETASAAEGLEGLQQEQQPNLAAASRPVDEGPPTVQYVVTRNMRRVLADELGYTPEEVEYMKPDVAAVITTKRLKRPSSGMPDEFYIDGKAPTSGGRFGKVMKSRVVRRVVIPALIAGTTWGVTKPIRSSGDGRPLKNAVSEPTRKASIMGTKGDDGTGIGEVGQVDKPRMANPSAKKALLEPVSTHTEASTLTSDAGSPERDSEELLQLMQDEGMSIESRENYPKDLDETWLDKCITFILERLDSMFRFRF